MKEGIKEGIKEGNVLVNDTLNTFYLWLYGRKEVFYLMPHSTHFVTVIWRQTYGKGPFR